LDIDEIQRRARKGPRALLARRAFAVLIGVATTVTIPHFVPPRAYGLAAMSGVILGLAEMFKDFGLTSALMRKGEVHPAEVTFLFWFNCATTLVLALVIAAAAPLTGIFFHEPMVAPVMLVSLIGFVAGGLSLQHRSLLSRELRFQALAAIDAGALLIQFVVTLVVAMLTHDVWAIVAGNVVSGLVGGALCAAVSRWRPGPPRLIPEARALFAFGANTSVYSLSVFAANNVAALLIGRVFGSADLGQFNRAQALQVIPANNAIGPIAQATLPVLAGLRPHPEHYRRAYLELVRNLNLVALPMAVVLTFAARPLVSTVLGPQWTEAGQLLQALAPAVAALGFGYAASDLFITQNRSAELRTLGLCELVFRVLGVCAAAPFGVVAIAASFSATTLLVVVARVLVAGRSGPVTVRDHVGAAGPAAILGLGALVGCLGGQLAVSQFALPVLPAAVVLCAAGGAVSGLFGLVSKSSRRALIEMMGTLRGAARRPDPAVQPLG